MFEIKEAQEWIRASNKIEFLFSLLKELRSNGHKVLIFSKTKILLNLVESIIRRETDYGYLRLDGDVPISKRDAICQDFNKNENIFCFLLTNQVSGVGLNLVSADRAIIIDPDWNPANDNQCIDRVYRIG
jgi:SNF2 family DNA or RNA helicase